MRTAFNRLAAAARPAQPPRSGRSSWRSPSKFNRSFTAKMHQVGAHALADPRKAEFYRGLATTMASDAYVRGGYRYTSSQRQAIDRAYQHINMANANAGGRHGSFKRPASYVPAYAAPLRSTARSTRSVSNNGRRLNRSTQLTRKTQKKKKSLWRRR